MINVKMQPTEVQSLSPKISVIGVGGAGGNAVNNMISSNLEGCEFIVCNTDAQALSHSLCENKMQLGTELTGGLGAGSKPEIGRQAAEESLDDVMACIEGSNMVFVTAGMGGGTGTGAAPIIARACRENGILTVGVVTKPFHFEGSHRMKMAEEGIKEMQDYVDTLIVIPNQNLFRIANEKTTFADAFRMADGVLQSGVRGVTDLMVRPGLVNLDFADIRTAMLQMGKAMMGTGEASGDNRAIDAAEAAINNPLLDDVSMKGAQGVIINVTGGDDMTLFETDEACNRIREEVDPDANIIFGTTFDESLEGSMRVSIVATGIEKEAISRSHPQGGTGSNGGTSLTGKKSGFERAIPNVEKKDSSASVAPAATAASVRATDEEAFAQPTPPKSSYVAGAQSIKGITAPTAASNSVSQDPDADLFEQTRFESGAPSVASSQNSMRGTRYEGAFIPPKPAIADLAESAPVSSPMVAPQRSAAPAPSAVGLNLNPPKAPEHKRAPSLFERLSNTISQVTGREDSRAHTNTQSAPLTGRSAPVSSPVPQAAAQGSLAIDAPSAQPATSAEDDLDIPAFLRRQAN